MKTLIVSDGQLDISGLVLENALSLELRKGEDSDVNLMDLYESLKPELIQELRSEIIEIAPQRIVAIGRLDGYLWNGTVISRCFGQFNSWNNQRSNPFGKTIIKVSGNDVELIAIESIEDWNYVG